MKAVIMAAPAMDGSTTSVADIDEPQPGPGQVAIDVAYAGVNFIDAMARRGDPGYAPAWPYVPGRSSRSASPSSACGPWPAPFLAVAATAVMFLHQVPGGGTDIALELAGAAAGAAMGAIGGLATRLRLGADGRPLGCAGALAASLWIAGVGARMAFACAATPAPARRSPPSVSRTTSPAPAPGSRRWS